MGMAAIDSLLGIAEMKKASGVALATNEVPALITGGGRTPLTMPPLSATMLEALLDELLNEGQRQQLAQGQPVETEYRTAQGSFSVKARVTGGKTTLTVRKGTAAAGAAGAATRSPAASPPGRQRDDHPGRQRDGHPGRARRAARWIWRRASPRDRAGSRRFWREPRPRARRTWC